jgi:S-adenosyl methyltransferase
LTVSDQPVPDGVDVTRPSAARIYDYMLGGDANFAADRASVASMLEAHPEIATVARDNRAFLGRAVRHAALHGVRQFIDLGSGVPSLGNVHEIARQVHADARVVYVDIDPVAVAHARALVGGDDAIAVVEADIREPTRILAEPDVGRLIDFDEPFALVAVSVLHFVADADDPAGIVEAFTKLMTPGCYLLMSHAASGDPDHRVDRRVEAAYERAPAGVHTRTPDRIREFFTGFELAGPDHVVNVRDWQPAGDVPAAGATPQLVAVVGRKVPPSCTL